MTSRANGEATFQSAVDQAISRMITCEHFSSYSRVRMPIWLPSGTGVIVEVWPLAGDSVTVTDGGTTYGEAEALSAETQFKYYAPRYVNQVGVRYENEALSIPDISYGQIAGAIGILGSCAKHILDHAVETRDKKRYRDDTQELYERLVKVFNPRNVARNVEFAGDSTHVWRFATAVSRRDRQTIFEPVANHTNSIASTSMKFHDLKRLDDPPGRISVVRNKQEYGDMIAILAQASDVIERSATDETIQNLVGNARAA